MKRIDLLAAVLAVLVLTAPAVTGQQAKPAASANPVLVFDTGRGSFEIELIQADAPRSVAHILALMKRNFYRGQRFHRVSASLAQWGDPQSRDMSRRDYWGNGNSGSPIGVFESSKKHSHVRGAVGLAHGGNPLGADSQLYIMKTPSPNLDSQHAVIGRVTAGMAAVDKIAVEDMIKNARVK
jgi:cyclophilin family peptidyl-prolyl cis-trans isomerase